MRHVLSVRDFSREYVEEVLRERKRMARYIERGIIPKNLGIRSLAKATHLFLEPSTRTRGSFDEATRRLGFYNFSIVGPEATSFAKKESFTNGVRTLGKKNQGADLLIMRTAIKGAPRLAAEVLERYGHNASVLSGGDGPNEHPTQALMDWAHIEDALGRTGDFILGIVGDLEKSRVAHSVLEMARLMGVKKIRLVSAPEVRIQPKYKRGFQEVKEGESLELLKDCHVIVVLRFQEERWKGDLLKMERAKGLYRINRRVLDSWRKDVIVLHPQPCLDEIDPAVYDDPRIAMFGQSEKGVSTRMATCLLSYLERTKRTALLSGEGASVLKMTAKRSIAECMDSRQARKGKAAFEYFRPITHGTIIDRIPLGQAMNVRSLLIKMNPDARDNGVVMSLEGVAPLDPDKPKKDILVLERIFPSDEFFAATAVLWPDVHVNSFEDGTQRKFVLDTPKVVVKGYRCPDPDCITRHDPEELAPPRFRINRYGGETAIECAYCEQEFPKEEILRHLLRM